jgi:hypothetical protein
MVLDDFKRVIVVYRLCQMHALITLGIPNFLMRISP